MAVSLLPAAPALAADHRDSASVDTDPSTDINDVYAWVDSGGQAVYLAMTVYPVASTTSKFSNSAYYVFHTNSRPAVAPAAGTNLDIICGFDNNATQNISCWFGDSTNFVFGNASNAATPLSGSGGAISIFAGPRKDHFFFNLDGYNRVRANVRQNAGALTFNANGCPTAPAATLTAQAVQLGQAPGGGAAKDFFITLDTLAIVLKVPVTMLNKGGPIMSVWAGTYRKG